LEKNFAEDEVVTKEAAPSDASTSSSALLNALTKVVFHLFSLSSMVRMKTSPSLCRSIKILVPIEFSRSYQCLKVLCFLISIRVAACPGGSFIAGVFFEG
jgi:hypothetical protein